MFIDDLTPSPTNNDTELLFNFYFQKEDQIAIVWRTTDINADEKSSAYSL